MDKVEQTFSASLAKDAVYTTGLRSVMEYRDLGVEGATHGQFRAHVIRIKKEAAGNHELHTTGLHRHLCDFQMFCSDDLEVLEVYSPAVHETVVVDGRPAAEPAVAAAR